MRSRRRLIGAALPWCGLVLTGCPSDGPVGADGPGSSSAATETDPSSDPSGSLPLDSTGGSEGQPMPLDSTGSSGPATTTGPGPSCGNGVVEGDEECDEWAESPTCDADCTFVTCGDGVANISAAEVCDGDDLLGATCMDLGHEGGTLACDPDCASLDTSGCTNTPQAPTLALSFSAVKQFDFSWDEVEHADYYQLYQSAAPGEPFVLLGEDIVGTAVSHTMPLYRRHQASYYVSACNTLACTDSAVVDVMDSLVDAVGYFKASNSDASDWLGESVALSSNGDTLAVGALFERSNTTGIDGDQADNSSLHAGAVYVFARDATGAWSQQAYVKASNTSEGQLFGISVALGDDGNTLAVGAHWEDGNATGIDGDQADSSSPNAGAVYVFSRDPMGAWSQQAYVKASNTDADDMFGTSVTLSGDGNTLAVGAHWEDSNATGIGGDQADDSSLDAGAVYLFARDPMGMWSQQAYLKASNTDPNDEFGYRVELSGDGNTLAVSAHREDSNATGIDGNQADDSAGNSGAVYVFVRDPMGPWSQQAYLKASNTDSADLFGDTVALSGDGNTLAVGAWGEDSNATGINGNQADNSLSSAGAAYVFSRDPTGLWSQQAYLKASNTQLYDRFGRVVTLSGDGNTLAVDARLEDSNATGIDGNPANNSFSSAGAVYVFSRDPMGLWSQQAYLKASNTGQGDEFGYSVALSDDGDTLAVGANREDSNTTGIDGDQTNDLAINAGAVYLY